LILTCERCKTRFRLDEKRLPAGGARVRCSRCKHAFFVNPGGAPAADLIHQLAEAAVTQARMPAPAPSWDLEEDAKGRTAQSVLNARTSVASDPLAGDFEEESDWRFEDEMQLGDTGVSLDLPNGEAPAPPNPDPNESSFAELGDPESWDLLSSPVLDPPQPRPSPPVLAAMPTPQPIERVVAKAPVQEPSEPVQGGTAATRVAEALAIVPGFEFSPAARGGAWFALVVLVALATWTTIVPVAPAAAPQLGVVSLGALELRSVRARQIENAVAGPIWVVSGELWNPSDEPRAVGATFAVSLLDRAGAPIGAAEATLNAALSTQRLREEDPARLREEADAAASELAAKVLAPGASVAVDAVFATPAREATRFAVETRPARVPAAAVPTP
jgi:predicted Zn finger-like uncharacterized protein